MRNEIWKDIPNYEGVYQTSNFGNIKSFKLGKERLLNPYINSRGYYSITLHNNKIKKERKVHQLVAEAFLGYKPNGMHLVIDHINNIQTDNRLENLQIINQRLNTTKNSKKTASKYVGVFWHKQINKWYSRIYINGADKYLGVFKTEIEAHQAYQNQLK
jgi:hypothetical protein